MQRMVAEEVALPLGLGLFAAPAVVRRRRHWMVGEEVPRWTFQWKVPSDELSDHLQRISWLAGAFFHA